MVRISANPGKKNPRRASVTEMFESCIGCKWSLHVLGQIRRGVCRPGALERSAPGLTAKVLNERLAKLSRFGVIERTSYPEIPPRVEYTLTPFGQRFVGVLDQIESLRRDLEQSASAPAEDEAGAPPHG